MDYLRTLSQQQSWVKVSLLWKQIIKFVAVIASHTVSHTAHDTPSHTVHN